MIVFGCGLVAALVSQMLLLRIPNPRLTLKNFRGRKVKVVGGIVIALGLMAAVLATGGLRPPVSPLTTGLLVLSLGFFFLGLLDDLVGDRASRGFGGHLKALSRGRVTTGVIKALGGVVLAAFVSMMWESSLVLAVLDALVIALSANLINLLDLRPGRAAKAFLVLLFPLALLSGSVAYFEVSFAMAGATAAWLFADLRERGMLGDSGANMLGAMLGAGVVLNLGVGARSAVLVLLVGLTLASERWSFSQVINSSRALSWFDRLGRLP